MHADEKNAINLSAIFCTVSVICLGTQVVGIHDVGVDILLQFFHDVIDFDVVRNAVNGNARVSGCSPSVQRCGICLGGSRDNVAHAKPLVKNTAMQIYMRKFREGF